MITINVEASHSYEILIGQGLIDSVGEHVRKLAKPCAVAIITDDIVEALYAKRVSASLSGAGYNASLYAFPNGEAQKHMDTLSGILEFLAVAGLTKSDLIIALGGGVVGDVTGLAAALYLRGMRFVQVPTTLLAAVDSSVGGKTAVNLNGGKNLAGVFAQPSLVICDTDIMRALPHELTRDGMAEVIKYGVLENPALLEPGQDIGDIVAECVRIKCDYVEADEFDEGKRQLLNLGHTFGHAVEKCSGYTIPHGQAVGIGMVIIARAAHALGVSKENTAPAIIKALDGQGLPIECPYGFNAMISAAALDKKRRGGSITLAVPIALGKCQRETVGVDELPNWLRAGGVK